MEKEIKGVDVEKLAQEYSEMYPTESIKAKLGYIAGYTIASQSNAGGFSLEDMKKAIEMARDIFDGKETFTGEDVSGCTEVCTYGWKYKNSEKDIIQSLTKGTTNKS